VTVTDARPAESSDASGGEGSSPDDRVAMTGEAALAIICGGGTVPRAIAEVALKQGRRVVLFPLRGFADTQALAAFPQHEIALGQLGRFVRLARAEGCHDVVFVGGLVRPSIWRVRFDWRALTQMPHIVRSFRGGDDHLLTGMARLLERDGFRLIGVREVAPDITAPPGVLGLHQPDESVMADIARGFAVLDAMSPFDVGQAVVVARRRVLAVEAAEGTDAMLERIVALRQAGRIGLPAGTGVLVKAPKRNQDRRFDLPSVGPGTIARAAQAGLSGLAVVARATVVAEPQRFIAAADEAGLFVVGCPDPQVQA
jgi:UDP-2,3-diacylglucosamine hydrolase